MRGIIRENRDIFQPKKNGGAEAPPSVSLAMIALIVLGFNRAVGRRYRECTVAAYVVLRVELRVASRNVRRNRQRKTAAFLLGCRQTSIDRRTDGPGRTRRYDADVERAAVAVLVDPVYGDGAILV